MSRTIAFINMKGGVGKTTLAVNIAYTLGKIHHKKVLLIDMDPQMNATQYTLTENQINEILEDRNRSAYGFLCSEHKVNGTKQEYAPHEELNCVFSVNRFFSIIPSSLDIMKINLGESPFKLRQYIAEKLERQYDIIIIDCPPTISAYTKVSLLASDMYVVPMKADPLSLFGLPMLQNYISETIEGEFEHKIDFVGIILNMVNSSRLLYRKNKPKISQKWKNKLFLNELSQRECIIKGLDDEFQGQRYIVEMSDGTIAQQMKDITTELLQKGRL